MAKKFDIEFKEKGIGSLYDYVMYSTFIDMGDDIVLFYIVIDGKRLERTGNLSWALEGLLEGIYKGNKTVGLSSDFKGFEAEINGENTEISAHATKKENKNKDLVVEIPTKEFIETVVSVAKKFYCSQYMSVIDFSYKELQRAGINSPFHEIVEQLIPELERRYLNKPGEVPDDLFIPREYYFGDVRADIKTSYMLSQEKNPLIDFKILIPQDYNKPFYLKGNKIEINLKNHTDVLRKDIPEVVKKIRSENPDEIELPLDKDMKVILKKDSIYFEGNQYQDEKEIKLTEKRREALLSKLERFSGYLNYLYYWIVEKGDKEE